jgi:hypothetical protein
MIFAYLKKTLYNSVAQRGCSPLENFLGKNRKKFTPSPWKISSRKISKVKFNPPRNLEIFRVSPPGVR